jgi:hypothetical protein
MQGVEAGKRNAAAKPLTVALFLDGYPETQIKEILTQYAMNCNQTESQFTVGEGLAWFNWVKERHERGSLYWSCKGVKDLSVHDAKKCNYCNQQNTDVLNFLEEEDVLNNIVKIIQQKIPGRVRQKVVSEEENLKHLFLVALSTYTNEPQNRHLEAESSVGKTAVAVSIEPFFPPEDIIAAASLSKKSLYYSLAKEVDGRMIVNLTGKIIIVLEAGNCIDFLKEIKPILSHDMEQIEVHYVDTDRKKDKGVKLIVMGWPTYVGLSVESTTNVEQNTREWQIFPIHSSSKFKAVMLSQSYQNTLTEKIVHPQNNLLKKLILHFKEQQIDVINFWMPLIAEIFPSNDPRCQRDLPRFKAIIELITRVNYRMRGWLVYEGKKVYLTEKDDIIEALKICEESMRYLFTGISKKHREVYEKIFKPLGNNYNYECVDGDKKVWLIDGAYTIEEACAKFNKIFRRNMVQRNFQNLYAKPLIDANLVLIEKHPGDGRKKLLRLNPTSSISTIFDNVTDQIIALLPSTKMVLDYLKCEGIDNTKIGWGGRKNSRLVRLMSDYFTNQSMGAPPISINSQKLSSEEIGVLQLVKSRGDWYPMKDLTERINEGKIVSLIERGLLALDDNNQRVRVISSIIVGD